MASKLLRGGAVHFRIKVQNTRSKMSCFVYINLKLLNPSTGLKRIAHCPLPPHKQQFPVDQSSIHIERIIILHLVNEKFYNPPPSVMGTSCITLKMKVCQNQLPYLFMSTVFRALKDNEWVFTKRPPKVHSEISFRLIS